MAPVLVFAMCFAFWLLLSGHPAPLQLLLGALAAAGVALVNRDLEVLSRTLRAAPRFAAYLPWLLKEIVLANLQVARVVLHPKLPIDPVVARFAAPLRTALALTTLGNSITLTPGTVTLDVEGRELTVHCLLGPEALVACQGPMAERVARVFGEAGR